MARAIGLSLRAMILAIVLGVSFGANALPMSPKWMKSSGNVKKEPTPGDLGNVDPGTGGGGGPLALPLPGSIWLIVAGVAMLTIQRRKKSAS